MSPATLGGRGRVVLEDLCDDLTTLGEVVQREPEHLVIRAPEHAAVAVGLGGLASLGFPHQAQLVDLTDAEADRRVALLHDERVAPEPDEMQLPEDPAVVERDLPAVVLLRRDRGSAEQGDPSDPEGSHCPSTFPVFAAAAACFFFFFFLRRGGAFVPREILPHPGGMSPLSLKPPLFASPHLPGPGGLVLPTPQFPVAAPP